ncbi:YkvA family protein [Chryseomicrobium palamuruense]|uniref:YkvA family protein n=1 Tax=Chryseomicrobium palamuruense TaxID=682973 RepID=A0ABV8UWW2_9BACL
MKRNKSFKDAHKPYESHAKGVMNHPKRRENLLKAVALKAASNKNSLGDAKEQALLLVEFVKAWYKREYRHVSKGTILSIVAALLYFVSPIDLIPDFLLGIGFIDDIAVLGFAYKRISKDLEKFKAWKVSTGHENTTNEYISLHRQ